MPDDDPRLLVLAPDDNVCVACADLAAGSELVLDGRPLVAGEAVPLGFKLARRDIAAGERILKYGAAIGSATRAIARGEVVHLDNMKSDYLPTYTLADGSRFIEGEKA